MHNRRFDPIIGIAGDGRVIGLRLTYVSEGVFLMRTPDEERAFLAAYRELQKRMERSRLAFRLGRGDLLVFNNRRMTHGRTAIEKNPALGDSAVRIFKVIQLNHIADILIADSNRLMLNCPLNTTLRKENKQ